MQKSRPNQNVVRFFQTIAPESAYISALSLGELRRGVALRAKKDFSGAQAISVWVDQLERNFAQRVLVVDEQIARIWGELSADRSRPIVDTLLAATAIHHRLTLVTRNVRDVEDTPVTLRNPWLG